MALAAESPQAAGNNVEEVVVTGSRIERAGYEAPTPVTMQNRDEIQAAALPQLADYLARLPSFEVGVGTNKTNHNMNGGKPSLASPNCATLASPAR